MYIYICLPTRYKWIRLVVTLSLFSEPETTLYNTYHDTVSEGHIGSISVDDCRKSCRGK